MQPLTRQLLIKKPGYKSLGSLHRKQDATRMLENPRAIYDEFSCELLVCLCVIHFQMTQEFVAAAASYGRGGTWAFQRLMVLVSHCRTALGLL